MVWSLQMSVASSVYGSKLACESSMLVPFRSRADNAQVCGEHDKALQDFTRVLEMQPTNARALFRRAFSFKALKCYEEAAEDFEAAREFDASEEAVAKEGEATRVPGIPERR